MTLLQLDARNVRTQITETFLTRHLMDIPSKVWLVDAVGTRFGIIVEKYLYKGYFNHGMEKILVQYRCQRGLWMRLDYNGFDVFYMIIQTMKGRNTSYPLPPLIYPHYLQHLNPSSSSQATNVIARNWSILKQYQLTLSLMEAETDAVFLSAEMFRELKYLGKPESIKIEDEVGEQFPCTVIWLDTVGEPYVRGDCRRFF